MLWPFRNARCPGCWRFARPTKVPRSRPRRRRTIDVAAPTGRAPVPAMIERAYTRSSAPPVAQRARGSAAVLEPVQMTSTARGSTSGSQAWACSVVSRRPGSYISSISLCASLAGGRGASATASAQVYSEQLPIPRQCAGRGRAVSSHDRDRRQHGPSTTPGRMVPVRAMSSTLRITIGTMGFRGHGRRKAPFLNSPMPRRPRACCGRDQHRCLRRASASRARRAATADAAVETVHEAVLRRKRLATANSGTFSSSLLRHRAEVARCTDARRSARQRCCSGSNEHRGSRALHGFRR